MNQQTLELIDYYCNYYDILDFFDILYCDFYYVFHCDYIHTFVVDYYVKVDEDCVLGFKTTGAKTISLVNTSDAIDATFTSVVLNVTKEV